MPRIPRDKAAKGGIGYIYGGIGDYIPPYNLDGNRWRYLSYCQPVVMDCIANITMKTQALAWDVRAKDPNKQDELSDKIEYHKDIILEAGGRGYLNHISFLLNDFFMIPFGGATETVKYSNGELYKIQNIDGATLFPTNNPEYPVVQQYMTTNVTFAKDEIVRMFQSPRTEIDRQGWGMTPTEKIYLAVDMLSKGDKYYAGLLLDTPEAGLLDLGDMSRESAEKWLDSFRSLMTGIDGFKIPVLFEHTVPAKFIPFGRPPTDMLFDQITFKYAQLVCAAFGLTVGDISMRGSNGGLSSDIRDERHSKSTGYASVKAYLVQYFNQILPKDLEFAFIDSDDELLVSKGRARSTNAVAMRNFIESGTLTPSEARKQMKADGLISIPLTEEVQPEDFDIVKDISGLSDQLDIQEEQLELQKEQAKNQGINASHKIGGQGGVGLNKQRNVRGGKLQNIQGKDNVPVSQGGQGEIKAIYRSKLSDFLYGEFDKISQKLNKTRARKLAKLAAENIKPTIKSVFENNFDYNSWSSDYLEYLFETKQDTIITKSINDNLKTFSTADKFWYMDLDDTALGDILIDYYIDGLVAAGNDIQQILYEEDVISELEINYNPNPDDNKKDEIYKYVISLLSLINDGTDYYVKRISTGSIVETLKEPSFKERLKNGEDVYKSEDFINQVSDKIIESLLSVLSNRADLIAEYEADKMRQKGKLDQYKYVGFKEKRLIHIGDDIPCEHCQTQESLGWVGMNYEFLTKMGTTTPLGLLHPNCHHELQIKKDNVKDIKTKYLYE